MALTIEIFLTPHLVAFLSLGGEHHAAHAEDGFQLAKVLVGLHGEVKAGALILVVVEVRQERAIAIEPTWINGRGTLCEQTIGELVEVVDINGQQAVPQRGIETDAPLLALDKAEVGVGTTLRGVAETAL